MKKLFILMVALLALAFSAGTASASEYCVVKGDCLYKIGAKLHLSWEKIAADNGISEPWIIYPDQKLAIDASAPVATATPASDSLNVIKRETVNRQAIIHQASKPVTKIQNNRTELKIYADKSIGADKYTGTREQAMLLIDYPSNAKLEYKGYAYLKFGDIIKMTSGKNKVAEYTVRFSKSLQTREFAVIVNGKEIGSAFLIKECSNWYRDLTPRSPVIVKSTLAPVTKKQYPIIIGKAGLKIEQEPIIWAYKWENHEIAKGWGGGVEYMAWLRRTYRGLYENGWSPGVGFYATYAEGESKVSKYEWSERAFGPSVGLKYIGLTPEGNSWQWQVKFRYAWELQRGSNHETGYSRKQWNEKPGLYTELLYQLDDKWLFGLQAEGWLTTGQNLHSTWSGDRKQNRDQLAIFFLAQRKFNDDWSGRLAFGPFYSGWDKMWGMRFIAEARYKEMLMFGPSIAFYPFGIDHDIYKGYSAGDLTTWMAFVRLELGNPIRDWYANNQMKQIQKMDYRELGIEDQKLDKSL